MMPVSAPVVPTPFGLIFPGREMITSFMQMGEQRFGCLIPVTSLSSLQEFVVVLFQALPPGIGLAVYVLVPVTQTWQFMGHVSNDRPSEIMRLQNLPASPITNNHIEVGLALEPLQAISQLRPPSHVDAFNQFAKKMATNMFNFVESFEKPFGNDPNLVVYPRDALNRWFEKYMNRLSLDPNFWRV
eukprot:c18491_g1_i1.p1 GENE.c18491_g1_i1~~c18491_g1_i1.p1  ORF type:complete len:207 (-),score=35.11 c18491_g1_i1:74-631(-)